MVEELNMTLEEKQLLFIDLCMRLPYHPNIKVYNDGWDGMQIGEIDTSLWTHHIDAFWCSRIEITPYLRPMSSMTEEEKEILRTLKWTKLEHHIVDWLNSHHFDYRDLINKGLALEAPEGMYI